MDSRTIEPHSCFPLESDADDEMVDAVNDLIEDNEEMDKPRDRERPPLRASCRGRGVVGAVIHLPKRKLLAGRQPYPFRVRSCGGLGRGFVADQSVHGNVLLSVSAIAAP